jgi:hypothetical protein
VQLLSVEAINHARKSERTPVLNLTISNACPHEERHQTPPKDFGCVGDCLERGFEGVLERLGGSGGRCVCILDTSELEKTFDGWGSDKTGTTWSWDELLDVSNLLKISWIQRHIL